MQRRSRSFLFFISTLALCVAADGYKLDLKTPAKLAFVSPYTPPSPTRIAIYRTGPRIWVDEKDTPARLSRRVPEHSLTNDLEIKDMLSALHQSDVTARVTNAGTRHGYTYHLLLFQEQQRMVMHFRVFEPLDTNTVWSVVWPRSESGFSYDNKEVVPWLKAHVKFATNTPAGAK